MCCILNPTTTQTQATGPNLGNTNMTTSITRLLSITTQLADDAAFIYSLDNNDAFNMQLVLRAYGLEHTYEVAQSLININR